MSWGGKNIDNDFQIVILYFHFAFINLLKLLFEIYSTYSQVLQDLLSFNKNEEMDICTFPFSGRNRCVKSWDSSADS